MLDSDLAQLYHIETGALNRQVKRNIERFPDDFCFQLSQQELDGLKCQIGRTNIDGRGGRRTLPWVFTEQGISMLSSVIHTDISIRANISIMRSFVKMRHYLADNAMVFQRLDRIELKQLEADEKFKKIFRPAPQTLRIARCRWGWVKKKVELQQPALPQLRRCPRSIADWCHFCW